MTVTVQKISDDASVELQRYFPLPQDVEGQPETAHSRGRAPCYNSQNASINELLLASPSKVKLRASTQYSDSDSCA